MGGIANGFAQLFKAGRKRISNAIDNYLLDAESRKAISGEVEKKFQPMIDRVNKAQNKRATTLTELGKKLNQSKKELADAQKAWQDKYDAALADAKNKKQTDIDTYEKELQGYNNNIDTARAARQNIIDQLSQQEATYNPTRTIYTDVNSGDRYLMHPITGEYTNITQTFKNASKQQRHKISQYIKGFDERLLDTSSGTPKVINAFDKATLDSYHTKNSIFDNYLDRVKAPKSIDLRNAESEITRAKGDLNGWKKKNSRPADWNDNTDLGNFNTNFSANNARPNEYSFNGKNYADQASLDQAYKDALNNAQKRLSHANDVASEYATKRDAEIAKRIQDAKDVKKAKLALGGALGAGALYAGAKAIYGGDDTPDNTNNIDNTDNTYTSEPDPNLKIENTPEGKAALNGKSIDTGFDPDKADAVATLSADAVATLAAAAHDEGVEDGNSIRSSDDLGNNIAATTRGHTMEDRLYELIKAIKDPYKADAVANYIYSRHGDDEEVQRLGWRGWLNKYYGDSLRSILNIDPSGYKGMHVSGGL